MIVSTKLWNRWYFHVFPHSSEIFWVPTNCNHVMGPACELKRCPNYCKTINPYYPHNIFLKLPRAGSKTHMAWDWLLLLWGGFTSEKHTKHPAICSTIFSWDTPHKHSSRVVFHQVGFKYFCLGLISNTIHRSTSLARGMHLYSEPQGQLMNHMRLNQSAHCVLISAWTR